MNIIVLLVAIIIAPLIIGFLLGFAQERATEEGFPIFAYATLAITAAIFSILGHIILSKPF